MKSAKKMFALILAMMLLVTVFAVPASAAGTDPCGCGECAAVDTVEAVQPRARACSCGGTYSNVSTVYGSWYFTYRTIDCTHGGSGKDYIYERKVYKRYSCTNCPDYYDEDLRTESKTECHGFAK